jgi:hypothetical protein
MERMNKEEIIDKIVEMAKEIKKLKEEINKQEEPKLGRWKPKYGERYYYLNGENILKDSRINYIDEGRYKIGNCFKTEEEAKFAVEQLKVLAELKEYADDDKKWNCSNAHWCIAYDADEECIDNDGCYHNTISAPFNIYFSSKEQAQKAIDAIGEERLKKYYFCVEE